MSNQENTTNEAASISEKDLAIKLGVTVRTLQKKRDQGKMPRFFYKYVGGGVGQVRYLLSDMPAWEAQKQSAKAEKAITDAIKHEEQRKRYLKTLKAKRAKIKLAKMEAQNLGGEK